MKWKQRFMSLLVIVGMLASFVMTASAIQPSALQGMINSEQSPVIITLDPGTYYAPLLIDAMGKDVTINATGVTILLQQNALVAGNDFSLVEIIGTGGGSVTLTGITVNGNSLGDTIAWNQFNGIKVSGLTNFTLTNATVTGIRCDPSGTLTQMQMGRGIRVDNVSGIITVKGCTVTDFQKNGIDIRNSGSVTVSGNEIQGAGAVDIAQNGIVLINILDGTISSNAISAIECTDSSADALGILHMGTGTTNIIGNKFIDVPVSIYTEKPGDVSGNIDGITGALITTYIPCTDFTTSSVPLNMYVGRTLDLNQFLSRGVQPAQATRDPSDTGTWNPDNFSIVSVNTSGVVTANRTGTVTITAKVRYLDNAANETYADKEIEFIITITEAPLPPSAAPSITSAMGRSMQVGNAFEIWMENTNYISGVTVDGTTLTQGTDYRIDYNADGSVASVILLAGYTNTLTAGQHTLVIIANGTPLTHTFTVTDVSSSSPSIYAGSGVAFVAPIFNTSQQPYTPSVTLAPIVEDRVEEDTTEETVSDAEEVIAADDESDETSEEDSASQVDRPSIPRTSDARANIWLALTSIAVVVLFCMTALRKYIRR